MGGAPEDGGAGASGRLSPVAQRALLIILGLVFAFAVIVTAIMETRPG